MSPQTLFRAFAVDEEMQLATCRRQNRRLSSLSHYRNTAASSISSLVNKLSQLLELLLMPLRYEHSGVYPY
jgi:hypothetical protein